MKLKSLNKFIGFLILLILYSPLHAEEEIDIWNQTKKEDPQKVIKNNENLNTINNSKISNTAILNNDIQIEDQIHIRKLIKY